MYALTNCVIYTGRSVLYQHCVIIENDKIKAIISENELPKEIQKIDLEGNNLTAGFIDLQLNGCGGVMVNEEPSVATLEIMHKTNLKSGTTSFLPTFITASDEGMKKAVTMMRNYLAKYSNQALGLHFEGPYISKVKKGTHPEHFIRDLDAEMKQFLLDNADVIRKITIACENSAVDAVNDLTNKGIVVSAGHSNADFKTANKAFANGITFATHLYNAMSPISSGRELGVVGAVFANDSVYAGIIVDGVHCDFENVKIAKKIKKDKLCIVTDAVAAAGSEITQFEFVGKTIYVQNGLCVDKNGTLSGASITMIESIKNAVNKVGITLDEALRMCNLYPAQAIGVDDKLGSIDVSKIANLAIFNNSFKVVATVVNGYYQVN